MYWLPYSSHTSQHPSQTPCLPWISILLKNWCSIHARWSESILKHSIRFCGTFPNLKKILLHIELPHVQIAFLKFTSKFIRVYSSYWCSCSFEAEIIKIGPSSLKMYSNNILNFQESTSIVNACAKKSGNHVSIWPEKYNNGRIYCKIKTSYNSKRNDWF